METDTYTPHVRWAQRKEFIYLKIDIDGATNTVVKLEEKKLFVSATGSNARNYEIEMEFFGNVDKEASTWVQQPRYIEMKLFKKEQGGDYWDRLLSTSGKRHWLSVDWAKWKDEDESDEELNLGGGAQQGFGNFDFGDIGGDDDDDEDDDMPPLEEN
uniref:CS domain-containing protein n=1 Tax=Paramoeba aestuarina TaxID=180227 RepID=A0A7S4KIY4_9EUKA|mmetsp:Transcript_19893/g.31186  ORF Transcript_19893/g.31186 Transcript_19893/m.31186 type:complete len:157 (+) Transcript_19893:58-528(+)|eukprot:CAMPEP_0201518994 /NCGR_PEP_ID=MMETSP0161_2-20130828/9674_1 /ASSEMBLY_ACC=CAM_ASM_000251 /TAXON_ID=180227 /ORGANISM="Neoparamoeba aestuarina, Strain SoJaBio B1-5/56/2" /LENGTH=156 /DNA_ID=CAMNT_0047916915 /DNA_START=35 /DNA_END=505 /DNA_ORIENTATION=+